MNLESNSTASHSKISSQQRVIRESLQQLVCQLEAGHSEALTAFLHAMGSFRQYSFGNVLLIATQKPDASRVAGIVTWNKLSRRVRRGEKGIAILAPVVIKSRKEKGSDEESEKTPNPAPVGFRRVYVWDISQTEGESLPTFGETTGEVGGHLDRLRAFVASEGISLEYDDGIMPAQGISYGGRIALLPGQTKPEEFSTLVHETAHEFLHKRERRAATTKTMRELEAEAVSFVVSRAIGLSPDSSADYIQLYNGDAELLLESLEVIQKTATQILSAIQVDDSAIRAV